MSKWFPLLVLLLTLPAALPAEVVPQIPYPADKLTRELRQLPPVEAATRTPGESFTLEAGNFQIQVDAATGALRGVADANGTPLLPEATAVYQLEWADGRQATLRESELRVVRHAATPERLLFELESSEFPWLRFRQEYHLQTPTRIQKNVHLESSAPEPVLVQMSLTAPPAPGYPGSYGFDVPPGYFAENHSNLYDPAQPPEGTPRLLPVTIHPALQRAAGIFTYIDLADNYRASTECSTLNSCKLVSRRNNMIQDQFVFARENDAWVWQNGQWHSLTLAGDFLAPSSPRLSYSLLIQVTDADPVVWYREMQALPEYRALMEDMRDPAWLDYVRYASDCGVFDLMGGDWKPGQPVPVYRPEQHFLAGDDPLEVISWVIFGWGTLGGVPSSGEWMTYEPAAKAMTGAALRDLLGQMHRQAPQLKLALYDWNCSFDPALPEYAAHPEYAATTREGKTQNSFFVGLSPWWPARDALPAYTNADYLHFYLGQVGRLPEIYGIDAGYIDAEAGDRYPDWAHLKWHQPFDRHNFKKQYRHASGVELPLVKNTPNSPYVSGGYWEGRGLESAGMEERWRAVGAKMLIDKLFQWEHRWSALLTWSRNPADPYYSNYIVGLGYKPHGPSEPLRKFGVIQAAYDMRYVRLLENRFTPCFWRHDDTDTEAYLLQTDNAVLLSTIGHTPVVTDVAFSISGELPQLGSAPLAWRILLHAPEDLAPGWSADYERLRAAGQNPLAMPEVVAAWKSLRVTSLELLDPPQYVDGAWQITAPVMPRQLGVIVMTEIPLVALAHGASLVQMPLPGVADISMTDYRRSGSAHRVTVESRLGCLIGFVGDAAEVEVDGEKTPVEAVDVPFQRVNRAVRLAPGRHELEFMLP